MRWLHRHYMVDAFVRTKIAPGRYMKLAQILVPSQLTLLATQWGWHLLPALVKWRWNHQHWSGRLAEIRHGGGCCQSVRRCQYDSAIYGGLDLLAFYSAGIKLIVTLTNNWSDYGGMDTYTSQIVGSGQVNFFQTSKPALY